MCRGMQESIAGQEEAMRFDVELVQLAEKVGVQFVRFLEQKLEDILPPAKLGASTTVSLSRTDVAGGRQYLVSETGRIHYGVQHAVQVGSDGTAQITLSTDAPPRRPAVRLSVLLAEGGDLGRRFSSNSPSLFFFGGPRAQENLEEMIYELLIEDRPGSFRVRSETSGMSARYHSAATAALAFQRLTRQCTSPDEQEVRKVPDRKQDKINRLMKLGSRPRVKLVGSSAIAALADLKNTGASRGPPAGGAASTGGAWGKGGGIRPATNAWGRGPQSSQQAPSQAHSSNTTAGAGAAGYPAGTGGNQANPAPSAEPPAKPKPPAQSQVKPPPQAWDEVPDSWDD